jgi:formate dehydrogenase gamma subunit
MRSQSHTYTRFSLLQRIEHLTLVLTFITLASTGLPQEFPTSKIGVFILHTLGGIENLRRIHHFTSAIVMLAVIFHLLSIGYKIFVLRTPLTMLPGVQDVKDGLQALLYNIGIVKNHPKMGRYNFEEKIEYWSFVWGMSVMGISGFIMWNPITVTRYLPGEFIPAAKAAHGGEAVLAVLAIMIWHMYGDVIKRFNKSMWTGTQSEDEMLHEHPLELDEIKAGTADRTPDPATLRKRQRIFFPIATVLAIVMLAGVYGFVNAEVTAVKAVPPSSIPLESPSPTPQP